MNKDIDQAINHGVFGEKYDLHMLSDPSEQALFYQMERLAEQYAKKFFSIMFQNDIGAVDLNLPIVFVNKYDAIYSHLYEGADYVQGQNKRSAVFDKNLTIRIVLPVRTKRAYLHKSLKSTIRHELIHYYLNLLDLPACDNDGLFWAYCYIYDAGAYAPMNEADQEKYLRFVSICDSEGEYASYSNLQILAEAIMLDDTDRLEEWNTIISWKKQLKRDFEISRKG